MSITNQNNIIRYQVEPIEIASLLGLLRQYDNLACDNFAKEALLFVIIAAIGFIWPIAHTVRVLSS